MIGEDKLKDEVRKDQNRTSVTPCSGHKVS